MSREIKFRVWDIDLNTYFYGQDPAVIQAVFGWDELRRYTLEQYTGLDDKNGKPIYEGDIVKVHHFYEEQSYDGAFEGESEDLCAVEWMEEACGFGFSRTDKDGEELYLSPHLASDDGIEVIGNIHQNPELLEDSDD